MKKEALRLFLNELIYLAKTVIVANSDLDMFFNQENYLWDEFKRIHKTKIGEERSKAIYENKKKKETNQIRMWIMIQSFLTATANISKILFPPHSKTPEVEKRRKERSDTLKKLLGISDENIFKNRNIRNHFEHFDERIDLWAKKRDKTFLVRSIAHLNKIDGSFDKKNFFHLYDPHKKVITFSLEPFDIKEIIKEMNDILQKVIPALESINDK